MYPFVNLVKLHMCLEIFVQIVIQLHRDQNWVNGVNIFYRGGVKSNEVRRGFYTKSSSDRNTEDLLNCYY